MEAKEALSRMVRAGRTALKTDLGLRNLGYDETPYFEIYGDIADAVYALIGETADPFAESVTAKAFLSGEYTDTQRVALLMREYEKNFGRVKA